MWSLLHLVSNYGQFIKHFAVVADPYMTRQRSMRIFHGMTNILVILDLHKPYEVQCDSCVDGGVLQQEGHLVMDI